MKYALFTGCVAKGAGRELLTATMIVADKLGIELIDMKDASCCGAGVVHEDNPRLADAINMRTFSLAEEQGLDIITICGTCQGVMRRVQIRCEQKPDYMKEVNAELKKDTGREYQGKVKVKHLYEVIAEEYGFDKLAEKVTKKLTGLKVGPYYGCYALRPHESSDVSVPDRPEMLEKAIEAVGATVVKWESMQKCCGFPILMPNKTNSLALAGNVLNGAVEEGADCLVTPCPLCHLNLDSYQPEIDSLKAEIPVLHYPQMLALALGASPSQLNLDSHIVQAAKIMESVKA